MEDRLHHRARRDPRAPRARLTRPPLPNELQPTSDAVTGPLRDQSALFEVGETFVDSTHEPEARTQIAQRVASLDLGANHPSHADRLARSDFGLVVAILKRERVALSSQDPGQVHRRRLA